MQTIEHKNFMEKIKLFAAIATAVATLLLGGKALAQPEGGFGSFQNMDPQQMQSMMQQFQNMDPQILQDMRRQFQNMDPQEQQDMIQQFQDMDPQQMQDAIQQRVDDSFREQMGVTNDTDWSLIEEKINAVTKARAAVMAGMMRGGGGFQAMAGQMSPEAQALQQAVDADAPAAKIMDLLAKLETARQAKQAALVKAQDDLRSVLTIRQEGIALLHGLLD